ncbi:MAG: bifunctional hydroxymethylpyrimidine kinase/phosphomethylpyrimidine kinase [Verrucomicrobia bacterium]|nr:bifunctional hydroxymethylpyrimidine kinase/phosphomethylpyrimidine kinase [Verrucomicrobiota bacterium]
MPPPVALTVAGSDNSAGAGIQADLKTFTHFRVFGQTVITCVVAEVPGVVRAIQAIDPENIRQQLELSLTYFPVRAVKTGMLYSAEIVHTVCDVLERLPLSDRPQIVVDPVMVASSGDLLLQPDAIDAYRDRLIPMAALVTPNMDEMSTLHGDKIRNRTDLERVGRELAEKLGVPVLAKGGHLRGQQAIDLLIQSEKVIVYRSVHYSERSTHGTGCTYSAAIAAGLALGQDLADAVAAAKVFVSRAIKDSFCWEGQAGSVEALKLF